MKLVKYIPIRDNERDQNPYWQIWAYDSREKSGKRLVELRYHTKNRAHVLANLLNHEIQEFIDLNNGDITVETKGKESVTVQLTFWKRIKQYARRLFHKKH